MSAEPITLEYELTQDWADTLEQMNRRVSPSVKAYYVFVYVLSVACAAIALGGAFFWAATRRDLSPEGVRLVTSFAGVVGAVAMIFWATRVAKASTRQFTSPYAVGTTVAYHIDATGIGLVAHQQRWHTGWDHIRDIIVEGPVLSVQTPYAIFSMPVAELPLPIDQALARMRGWQEEARMT